MGMLMNPCFDVQALAEISGWNTKCVYEVPEIIASITVYLQLTGKGHLRCTPFEQLCTSPNGASTVGNIFGTPVVE
jgi:hypothetical protein